MNLIVVISAALISAVVAALSTYIIQKAKICRLQKEGLEAIRKETYASYHQGFAAGIAHEQKQHAKALEKVYLDGYSDGQGNERDLSNGRHRSVTDDDTAVVPTFFRVK